ncbi:MAG TPA: tetratricopeptide repeat protein [Candidatus Kapabacteria bacterium]|nr:tetratricopeptide repeat protein [Candidatus Kapabacteria bacterium]
MRTVLLTIGTFAAMLTALHAQTDSDRVRAREICRRGIAAVDEGNLEKGLDLIQQAAALDPGNPNYRYEQAYISVMKGEYAAAVTMMEPLIDDSAAQDVWYQLLGNCYDYQGNPKKATETYSIGLKRFPNSGPLHLELGVMSLKEDSVAKAVRYWEQGIRHAPRFASNYYRAAKAFCSGTERLWGLLYGEIFMNLEPASKRASEISKLLFDTYAAAITLHKDSLRVNLLERSTIGAGDISKHMKQPYSLDAITAVTMACAAGMHKRDGVTVQMTVERLHAIREKFIGIWFERGLDTTHANVLHYYQKQLLDAGHFEAYDRYLFREADAEAFQAWYDAHEEAMKSWIVWMEGHSIPIDGQHYFSRLEER